MSEPSVSQLGSAPSLPSVFVWRRLHSLMGLFLVLFLCEHLLTNSEAALFIGEDGAGFIRMVNFLHSLPYLPVLEIMLLGIPFLIHIVWGIKYILEARPNVVGPSGANPALGYGNNWAYTFQRLTSWIILIILCWHVYDMRFEHYPKHASIEGEKVYVVQVAKDEGLVTLAARLNVSLVALAELPQMQAGLTNYEDKRQLPQAIKDQSKKEHEHYLSTLASYEADEGDTLAVCKESGTAILLNLREVFKDPIMRIVYTVFVLAACFHAFNGLWTFLLTWGYLISPRAQSLGRMATNGLMFVLVILGLSSIWLSTLVNLRA